MITFDYEQFNKKGLKDVVKWLEKQALPVKEVKGDNKPKRENGFQVKSAEIEFESGQVLVVKAKANVPAFFQVKLNGKVLAIRDYKQLDNEMKEIASFVKENEPKYSKNVEKAAAKAKVKVDVPKPVVTTTTEQVDAYKASLAELQGQSESLGNQITEVTAQVNLKAGQLVDLKSKLDAEKAITDELEAAIEKAKQENQSNIYMASNGRPFKTISAAEAFRVDNGLDVTHTVSPYTKVDDDGKNWPGYRVTPRRKKVFESADNDDLETQLEKTKQGIFEGTPIGSQQGPRDGSGPGCSNEDDDTDDTDDILESVVKCEYCGAPMSSTARRCMNCGKTPEQAHMAGKKNQEVE